MMKTQKLKKGKKHQKTLMYEFEYNNEIEVEEKQADGTKDVTRLVYCLKEGEKAYFSEEYRPEGVPKQGTKKPDITAIVENVKEERLKWYIYDMKDTVINADTALKLCSQWQNGIKHITNGYLDELQEYDIYDSLGVITRYWDAQKLQEEIHRCEERIHIHNPLMTAKKSSVKVNEYKEKIKCINSLIKQCFLYYDEERDEKIPYSIEFIKLLSGDGKTYTAVIDIVI